MNNKKEILAMIISIFFIIITGCYQTSTQYLYFLTVNLDPNDF